MVEKINWAAHWRSGRFILHTRRWSFFLRGPEDVPRFIERYVASTRRIPLGDGWRFVVQKRETTPHDHSMKAKRAALDDIVKNNPHIKRL